jgi:sugar phosphate isomerase/epimerase
MKNNHSVSRRKFLQTGMIVSGFLAAASPSPVFAGATKPERDPDDGLKLGIASYTFRKFTLDQAIAMTKQTGLKYINLKDTHLPLNSSAADCAAAAAKIKAAGLTLMGGGVIYMKNDEHQIRQVFEYARNAGMPMIVCSPEPEALDIVENMVKEFNLRIAIHNHGPSDKKYPSPLDVLKMVEHRDARMGICMDVGHTVRLGQDPVEVISQIKERLYDFHIKDINQPNAKGRDMEVGKGIIDIVGIFKEFLAMKFPGHIGLEYEANGDAPLPGVMESVAYMHGVLAAV